MVSEIISKKIGIWKEIASIQDEDRKIINKEKGIWKDIALIQDGNRSKLAS